MGRYQFFLYHLLISSWQHLVCTPAADNFPTARLIFRWYGLQRHGEHTNGTVVRRGRLREEGFVVQLSGTSLAFLFVLRAVSLLARHAAVLDHLAGRAFLEAEDVAALALAARRMRHIHPCHCS